MFESLEVRRLLTSAIVDHLGDLLVTGTAGDDTISVVRVDRQVVMFADALAAPVMTYDAASLRSIRVDAGAGHDTVMIDERLFVTANVTGGDGDDTLVGGGGSDRLDGGAGDDALDGRGGADVMIGRDGIDTVDYSARRGDLLVSLQAGAALPNDGEAGEGDAADATIEIVLGGAGDDVLVGGAGRDVFHGEAGADTVSYHYAPVAIRAGIDGFTNDGARGERDNVHVDVENLVGGSADDRLVGHDGLVNQVANTLDGGAGNDSLEGRNGDDVLIGGTGEDTLNGGHGADVLRGGLGTDRLIGGYGFDDVADYSDRAGGGVEVSLDGIDDDGAGGENDAIEDDVEGVVGSAHDDVIVGSFHANAIFGGAGNDTIRGAGGEDLLVGGPGVDSFVGPVGSANVVTDRDDLLT